MTEEATHVVDTAAGDPPGCLDTAQGRAELDKAKAEMRARLVEIGVELAEDRIAEHEPAHSLPFVILRKLLPPVGAAVDRWNARAPGVHWWHLSNWLWPMKTELRPGAKPAESETK